MGKQLSSIEPFHRDFIANQQIFFNASACGEGRVNVSPRDLASLRVLGPNTVIYLDLTGSGNETAAHLRSDGRLTLMFCAFQSAPMVLRLYGRGRILPRRTPEYDRLLAEHFPDQETQGSRQIVWLDVELVQTSCGMNVPLFEYVGPRDQLIRWAEKKGKDGLEQYWREKNSRSIDGFPTGIAEQLERSPEPEVATTV